MFSILSLFNVVVFNIIVDTYFYFFAVRKLTDSKTIRRAHWTIDALFVIVMLVLFFASRTYDGISHVFRQGFTFLYLTVYLTKAAYMFFSWPSALIKKRGWKTFFYCFGGFAGAMLLLFMLYGNIVGVDKLRVTEVEIASEDIPASFDGFRVVHLADLHIGNMRSPVILRKMVAKINEIDPDIVAFTGDMVYSRTREVYRYSELLESVQARDGVYAVMGNHDYGEYAKWPSPEARERNLHALQDFYGEIGWQLLNNRSAVLRRGADSVALIGVENWGKPPFPEYGDLKKAMRGVEDAGFKILMTHDPDHWIAEVEGKTDINLSLSGHTHAMQVAVNVGGKRISPAAWRYTYWGGLYRVGEQYLYVNEGIGAVLIPFRLGSWPELTVITLRSR